VKFSFDEKKVRVRGKGEKDASGGAADVDFVSSIRRAAISLAIYQWSN